MNRPVRRFLPRIAAWLALVVSVLPASGNPVPPGTEPQRPFHSPDVELQLAIDGPRRVWTYTAGSDSMVLEEWLGADGTVDSTTVLANGIEIARLTGALPAQDEATLRAIDSGLAWTLFDFAEFARRMDRAAARARQDLLADVQAALDAEKRAVGDPANDSETASPRIVSQVLCMPACWDCYGQEIRLGLTALGTAGTCLVTPATGLSVVGCAAGGAATVYVAVNAAPDCLGCLKCWLCADGVQEACDSEGDSGGGGGDPVDPGGSCPDGTHTGPTTACDGGTPCCCLDDPPHTCAVP